LEELDELSEPEELSELEEPELFDSPLELDEPDVAGADPERLSVL
jgi:hypothetical protein